MVLYYSEGLYDYLSSVTSLLTLGFSSILITYRWKSRAVTAVRIVFLFMEKLTLLLLTEIVLFFFLVLEENILLGSLIFEGSVYLKGLLIIYSHHKVLLFFCLFIREPFLMA